MWYNDPKAIIGEEILVGLRALLRQGRIRIFPACGDFGIQTTAGLWHSKNCLQGKALCGRGRTAILIVCADFMVE